MPENSPDHGKRMIVATNDPMAPYWIQQCCKQQGIFHGIQWISNTDELLAELKKSNADAAFVDMDFIGEKLMRFLNDLALSEVDVPIILVSSCEPRIFHAVADYARSLALNIVCAISRSRMAREVPVNGDFLLRILGRTKTKGQPRTILPIPRARLMNALHSGEIVAHFQPLHHAGSGRIIGAEALARWPISATELLPPAAFMKAIGDHGLMHELTLQMLLQSISFIKSAAPSGQFICSINVSASLAASWEWMDSALRVIRDAGVSPENIGFEVTEDGADDLDKSLGGVIANLRMSGFQCAMDDFGVGGSTLGRLLSVPFNQIKIDKALLHAARNQAHAKRVLSKAVSLAKDVRAQVVVEGVEDVDDLGMIRRMDADVAQGFLYSRALSCKDFIDYMRRSLA